MPSVGDAWEAHEDVDDDLDEDLVEDSDEVLDSWDEPDGEDDELEDEEVDEEEDELEDALDEEWDDEEDAEEEWEEDEDEDEDWWDEDADDYAPPELSRTLKLGFVAMAPLFLGYELALWARDGAVARSVSEVILSAPLDPFGEDVANSARRWILLGSFLLAFALVWRRSIEEELPVLPRIGRVIVEGGLGALALGPLLALASHYAAPYVGPLDQAQPGGVPDLSRAALTMGGAAYEEIVFRIGVLALGYVGSRQVLRWLGWRERSSAVGGALLAALISAVAFSASHLAVATSWLGSGGEAFSASAFTWRAVAGLLLAGLMCWRGVGVAAWAHAFYNLSRLIGL